MRRRSGGGAERQRTDERSSARGTATRTVRTARAARLLPALGVVLAVLALGPVPVVAQTEPTPETPPSPPELTIRFEPAAVVVDGVPPEGSVALLGVGRRSLTYLVQLEVSDQVLDDLDGDGSVRLELDAEIPERSLWAAVDLGSGARTLATPGEYPPFLKSLKNRGQRSMAGLAKERCGLTQTTKIHRPSGTNRSNSP